MMPMNYPPQPTMGGAGGFQPQPAPSPIGPQGMGPGVNNNPVQPAVPSGAQPLDPQQQQIMDVAQRNMLPEEVNILRQHLVPELVQILVKLFGPRVDYMLAPLLQLATSNDMMDSGDNIGGIDMEEGVPDPNDTMGQGAPGSPGGYPQGSVSSPFRGIRVG